MLSLPTARDKPLFTPGPLTTSGTVKQAMLRDLGSRDGEFLEIVAGIRRELITLAGLGATHEAVLMQGSGTFAIESVMGSAIPRDGKVLVLSNGAYGRRIVRMAEVLGIAHTVIERPEDRATDADDASRALAGDRSITHVAMVHSETTSGLINDIAAVGAVVRAHGSRFIVDAMSSFGGIETDWSAVGADYLVSSANKCIEGVPGFAFVLARREAIAQTQGGARSLSLDLFAQWQGLETDGQFRFTPPTHALLAFHQALAELRLEGGVPARAARYQANYQTLVAGTRALGLREFLAPQDQGPIIVSFRYPEDPGFDFKVFYERLNERGFVIYPGKVGSAACFRIGCIGRLFPSDMQNLVNAIGQVLA